MPFEDLEDRMVRTRDSFGITIDAKGGISLYIAAGHRLCKAKRVKTKIGNGKDFGLIILCESPNPTEGRAVNTGTNGKGWHIKYSTLSGAPRGRLRMVDVKHRDLEDGGVMLTLPWYKPVMDFNGQNVTPKVSVALPPPKVALPQPGPKPGANLTASMKDAATFSLKRG